MNSKPDLSTAIKAAAYLRDCCSLDASLRYQLAAIAHNAGLRSFYEWAEANPEKTIAMAETQWEILEQENLIFKGMQLQQ